MTDWFAPPCNGPHRAQILAEIALTKMSVSTPRPQNGKSEERPLTEDTFNQTLVLQADLDQGADNLLTVKITSLRDPK